MASIGLQVSGIDGPTFLERLGFNVTRRAASTGFPFFVARVVWKAHGHGLTELRSVARRTADICR